MSAWANTIWGHGFLWDSSRYPSDLQGWSIYDGNINYALKNISSTGGHHTNVHKVFHLRMMWPYHSPVIRRTLKMMLFEILSHMEVRSIWLGWCPNPRCPVGQISKRPRAHRKYLLFFIRTSILISSGSRWVKSPAPPGGSWGFPRPDGICNPSGVSWIGSEGALLLGESSKNTTRERAVWDKSLYGKRVKFDMGVNIATTGWWN